MSGFNEFWEKISEYLKSFFTEAEKIALTFLSAAAKSIASSGGALLTSAALVAVKAAQESGGTNDEKFQAAFDAVKDTLASEGIIAGTNAINVAIEAAVAQLKEDMK